jgi:hypothetical protein
MPLHVSADEGTDGRHGELLPADVLQGMADQAAADALSLEPGEDIGVRERHQLIRWDVVGYRGEDAVDPCFVPLLVRCVGDGDVHAIPSASSRAGSVSAPVRFTVL